MQDRHVRAMGRKHATRSDGSDRGKDEYSGNDRGKNGPERRIVNTTQNRISRISLIVCVPVRLPISHSRWTSKILSANSNGTRDATNVKRVSCTRGLCIGMSDLSVNEPASTIIADRQPHRSSAVGRIACAARARIVLS